jgi:RES domain-containing protein
VDIDAIAVSGEWIRHAPHASGLLGRPDEPTDGRWQHAAVARALYLADEPATAVAEWYRWLAERGLPPAHAMPHDHHVWQLDLQLANLGSAQRLGAVGLPAPWPWRRTWPAFSGRRRRALRAWLAGPARAERRPAMVVDHLRV